MTYCVAMRLNAGLVFLSDSRTNAGLDQISTFRKMTIYEREGDRVRQLEVPQPFLLRAQLGRLRPEGLRGGLQVVRGGDVDRTARGDAGLRADAAAAPRGAGRS